jgi:hypothetical protein
VRGHQAQGSGGKNYENDISPEYRRPVESIYTEVTAYLIQHCHTMDVLALAGINKKAFNIPSWVPDWSQQLSLRFLNNLLRSEDALRSEDEFRNKDPTIQASALVVFDSIIASDHEIQINANTGSMRIYAVNLRYCWTDKPS